MIGEIVGAHARAFRIAPWASHGIHWVQNPILGGWDLKARVPWIRSRPKASFPLDALNSWGDIGAPLALGT